MVFPRRQQWTQDDERCSHARPNTGQAGGDHLHGPEDHRQRVVWAGVPGQANAEQRDGGHQEGPAGQALQEQRAADHEETRPRQHHQTTVLLLLLWRKGGLVKQLVPIPLRGLKCNMQGCIWAK